MKHALLVSWLFPPHGSIGAKRAYRFARHLPTFGWSATVLCGRQPPAHLIDPSPWSVPDDVNVVADFDPEWVTTWANRLDAALRRRQSPARRRVEPFETRPAAPSRTSRVGDSLRRALPTETIAIHVPHARRVATRLVDQRRTDVVWTTSYPFSAHLIGVAIKRSRGVPFVADLRDPWTLNFTFDERPAPTQWIERRLERHVFAHADRVTVTTESLRDAYRARYPAWAAKFVTIRNGFDSVELMPARADAAPKRLVHFGHVYGARTLRPIFEALARLRDEGTVRTGSVVLENFGRLSPADRDTVSRLGLETLVAPRDPMPYADGLNHLRRATALLLPAWGTDRGRFFLPGKLYDYLLIGLPIVAVGDNDELADILARTRSGRLHRNDDVASIAAHLREVLEAPAGPLPESAAVREFTALGATERLARVFDDVCTTR